jgi:hypothetical protein
MKIPWGPNARPSIDKEPVLSNDNIMEQVMIIGTPPMFRVGCFNQLKNTKL